MAPQEGFKPPTPGLEDPCSVLLSYQGMYWWVRLVTLQLPWIFNPLLLLSQLLTHMVRPQRVELRVIVYKTIPQNRRGQGAWSKMLESNQLKAGCSRLHNRPDHLALVGTLKIELRLAVPQTAVLAIILRTPYGAVHRIRTS